MLGREPRRGANINVPRILVIILNGRQTAVTVECVRAVQAMAGPPPDVLLIDNGSGDGSADYLCEALPDIPLLRLDKNVGFAAGVNSGLQWAVHQQYAYALLLNNDAFPAPDMLLQLLAETAPDIAMLSPKVFYEEPTNLIWFAGGRQHTALLEMRDTGQNEADNPKWAATRDVDYLLGTGLLLNLALLDKIGLFDQRYFMYYEDLDLSIRARAAGYRLRLVGQAHLYHRVSLSSGGADSPMQRYHLARSSVLFFRRHAHRGRPTAILLYRIGSGLKIMARLLITGRWGTAVAYLRGIRDGLLTKQLRLKRP